MEQPALKQTVLSGDWARLTSCPQDLFSRQGYRAVGIDTLLGQAGVAEMTLYKQLGSKEELIAAAPGSREPILTVFDRLADWVHSPAFHGCLYIKAASRQRLENLCQELGGRDPERLARQLHLLLEGALVIAFMERDPRAASDAREAAGGLLSAAVG